MQQKIEQRITMLKRGLLFKIAEMALTSQEFFPQGNYQLHLNARRVGDEVKVSFYAIGDRREDKEIAFSKTYQMAEIVAEQKLKRGALWALAWFVVLVILAFVFFR